MVKCVIGVIFFVVFVFFVMFVYDMDMFICWVNIMIFVFVLIVICNLFVVLFMSKKKDGWVFGMIGVGFVLIVVMIFILLFLCVMVSLLKSVYDLIVVNVFFGDYLFKVMIIVVLILLLFVIGS